MMSDECKPVEAYVEAAPDGGYVVLCRIGAPNVPQNDYYILEGADVTIYPGHEPRYTEAEWGGREKPQAPQDLIERARDARHRLRETLPHTVTHEQLEDVADTIDDLLAHVEGAPDFCICPEKFWDPDCCPDLPPDADSSSRPYIEGGWAVEDPERPADDREDQEYVFLAPGCLCPRCKKPLPTKAPGTSTCGALSASFSVSSTDYPSEPHEADAAAGTTQTAVNDGRREQGRIGDDDE